MNMVCNPPGSVATAIDVDVDTGERWCGMCASKDGLRLGNLCPKCKHQLSWFQINNTVTAIGGWADLRRYCKRLGIACAVRESEGALSGVLVALKAHFEREDMGGAWDGPDC